MSARLPRDAALATSAVAFAIAVLGVAAALLGGPLDAAALGSALAAAGVVAVALVVLRRAGATSE